MGKRGSTVSRCKSTTRVSTQLLLSFLALSTTPPVATAKVNSWSDSIKQSPLLPYIPSVPSEDVASTSPLPSEHIFSLRHIFDKGTYMYPHLHRRLDVQPEQVIWVEEDDPDEERKLGAFGARSKSIDIQRLSDRRMEVIQPILSEARWRGQPPLLPPSAWAVDQVLGPDITDKETVISMALMSANAYDQAPHTGEWEDVGHGFNYSDSFGWEGDSLRGHIFADQDNSTVVIALKGTSPAVFDGAGTTTNDKINDNLFFSCCCGQGGQYLWHEVCECMTSTFTCNSTCVVKALRQPNRYYQAAIELYGNVTELYPESNVWLTGHSLGGSLSSLLGLTFGLPTITYEAPPQALAASRLGLPAPPGIHPSAMQRREDTGIYHVGHTADPIFMGSCNGATAACTLGGYAMETQCHSGQIYIYDVVKDKSWRVSASYHKIRGVIRDIIRVYPEIPAPDADMDCIDCFNWKYFESNGSDVTTSTSSTSFSTSTRTSTCKTPGWWGCLDETTTTASSTTSSTISTTATCSSYGWFGGCLDPITTTTTLAISRPTTTAAAVTPSSQTTFLSTSTCLTPGIIYGCKDKATVPPVHVITAAPVY